MPGEKETGSQGWKEWLKGQVGKVVTREQYENMLARGASPEKTSGTPLQKEQALGAIPDKDRERAARIRGLFERNIQKGNLQRARKMLDGFGEFAHDNPQAERLYELLEEDYRTAEKVKPAKPSAEIPAPPEPPKIHREKPEPPEAEQPPTAPRKPRRLVYLGMIPELKKKLNAQGLSIPGDKPEAHVLTPEEEKKKGFIRRAYEKVTQKAEREDREDYLEYLGNITNPDVALYNALIEINEALRVNSERWSHFQTTRIDLAVRRFRNLVSRDDKRFLQLQTLRVTAENLHKYDFEIWKKNRGGAQEGMQKILGDACAYLENGAGFILLDDPEVEKAFHEGKGMFNQDVDFTEGRTYEWADPNTGEKRDVVFRGGDHGGAERVGVFLRWITMVGHYDGYIENAAKAYTSHRMRWWHKYALGKGWMHGAKQLMYEYLDDGDVRLHSISAWPTMFHAPNQMTDIWYEAMQDLPGRAEDQLFEDRGQIAWEDKARLLISFGEGDDRPWTYIREEFENPLRYVEDKGLFPDDGFEREIAFLRGFLSQEQIDDLVARGLGNDNLPPITREGFVLEIRQAMFKKAVGIWAELGDTGPLDKKLSQKQWMDRKIDLKKKVLRNNMINDRWIMSFDRERDDAVIGVKPIIDIDAKDDTGQYRICLADLFYGKKAENLGKGWANNIWTYESYARKTEVLWEALSREDIESRSELWKNLIKAGNPSEAYRHLYGEFDEKTKEKKGLLQKYHTETAWLMEFAEPMLMQSIFELRENGQRLEVFKPFNEYIRMGLRKKFYQLEFEIAGLKGKDWTIIPREPLREMSERVAKVLSKMNDREVWINYMDDILGGLKFADQAEQQRWQTILGSLTPERKWQAIITFARFKIDINEQGNEDGYFEARESIKIDPHEYFPTDHIFWKYSGEKQREIINGLSQRGRIAHYYNMSLDSERTWGKDKFNYLSDEDFGLLMRALKVGVFNSRKFNYFMEVRNEHKVICQMIDSYINKIYTFDKRNHIHRDYVGGLPLNFYKRETLFNEKLRDMKYALGSLQGKYVIEQLAIDKTKPIVDEGVKFNGRTYTAKGFRLALQDASMTDIENKATNANLQPIYPIFHQRSIFACQGADLIWSVVQGTGEHHAGMDLRITPGYLFFDRDRYMWLLIAITADPWFRAKAYFNSDKDWEDDKGSELVADPIMIDENVESIALGEGDPNWGEIWHRLTNTGGGNKSAELKYNWRRRGEEIFVPLFEKKGGKVGEGTEKDLGNVQKVIEGAVAITEFGPLKGTGKGFVQSWFGRNGKETRKMIVLGGIPAVGTGLVTASLAAAFSGPFAPIIAPSAGILGGLIAGRITNAALGGDGGVEPGTRLERDKYDNSRLGRLRLALVKNVDFGGLFPMSMMKEREKARSLNEMFKGNPIWDSIANMKGWAQHLFTDCKKELVNEIEK